MGPLLRRLWYAIHRRRFDADLAEELEFHRAMKQRELEQDGLRSKDAPFATRRALGSTALAQDTARDVWLPRWLQGIGQDVRLALRSLRGTPIVTAVAALSLALGIGANTAIFSLVNSLILRPLPVKSPGRLVLLSDTANTGYTKLWSYAVSEDLRHRPQLFDGTATWSFTRFNTATGGESQFVEGLWTSASFFDVLGVPVILGRTFADRDDRRGGGPDGPVAVISYDFWQRRFGGAANVIGQSIVLDGLPVIIVGVTPRDFFGADVGRTFNIAVPIGVEPLMHGLNSRLDRDAIVFSIIARLKPGQTLEGAVATFRGMQPQIRDATVPKQWRQQDLERYLGGYLKDPFTLVPAATGHSMFRQRYTQPLVTILVVVALVLLIACANVANLLLARAAARRHELTVRVALGASRWRLARQLLTESTVLAAVGAAGGLGIAYLGSRLLVRQLSTGLNANSSLTTAVFLDLSIDWRVLVFTIVTTATAVLVFGIAPALRASRVAAIEALKEQRTMTSRADVAIAGSLVVAQVALTLVMVMTAGLFVRTFASLAGRRLGFDAGRVLLVDIDAQRAAADPERRRALYERAREAVRAVPGVGEAGLAMIAPVSGIAFDPPIERISGPDVAIRVNDRVLGSPISPGWLRTLAIPVLAGRDFTEADRANAPAVAIVNESFARKFLNGANPVDRTVTIFLAPPDGHPTMTIVGLVRDSVYVSMRDPVPPTFYVPIAQFNVPLTLSLGVRAAGGSRTPLARSIAAAVGAVDPNLTVTLTPLAQQVSAAVNQERVVAWLASAFATLALLLAALGLYGVTAYGVSRRRTEIGIRMALGAAAGSVVRLVLSRLFLLVIVGVGLGGIVSLWASRFIATLLYGVEPRDPRTLIDAVVVLASVAAVAAWLPARRASRVDPAVVLRCE